MRLRYVIAGEYEVDTTDPEVRKAYGFGEVEGDVDPSEFADVDEELLNRDPVEFVMASDALVTCKVEVVQS